MTCVQMLTEGLRAFWSASVDKRRGQWFGLAGLLRGHPALRAVGNSVVQTSNGLWF